MATYPSIAACCHPSSLCCGKCRTPWSIGFRRIPPLPHVKAPSRDDASPHIANCSACTWSRRPEMSKAGPPGRAPPDGANKMRYVGRVRFRLIVNGDTAGRPRPSTPQLEQGAGSDHTKPRHTGRFQTAEGTAPFLTRRLDQHLALSRSADLPSPCSIPAKATELPNVKARRRAEPVLVPKMAAGQLLHETFIYLSVLGSYLYTLTPASLCSPPRRGELHVCVRRSYAGTVHTSCRIPVRS